MRCLTWVQYSMSAWVAIFSLTYWRKFIRSNTRGAVLHLQLDIIHTWFHLWIDGIWIFWVFGLNLNSQCTVVVWHSAVKSFTTGRRHCWRKLFTYVNKWERRIAHSYHQHIISFLFSELMLCGFSGLCSYLIRTNPKTGWRWHDMFCCFFFSFLV